MQIDAGWYGKLPTLGDFATRRLPPAFTEAWDAWLAAGLAEWKARGDGWLDEYLAGPVWRFVAAPGVLAPPGLARGWAGVIAPSLDRVERHFPFTVAIGFAPQAVAPFATMLVHWLHHVGGITGDALRENWTPEQLDEALAELAEATVTPTGDAATHDELVRLVAASVSATGHVLWWRVLPDGGVELQRSHGLPRGEAFARLLAGQPMNLDPLS